VHDTITELHVEVHFSRTQQQVCRVS